MKTKSRRVPMILLAAAALLVLGPTAYADQGRCERSADIPKKMLAIVQHEYGGPDRLNYEQVAVPKPKRGELLVKMQASSVNPIDWKLREGMVRNWWPLKFPAIHGRDGAGVVVALGDGVTEFQCGDAVVVAIGKSPQGAHAQYIRVDLADVAPKPETMSFVEAAAYPLVALTAWDAVISTARVSKGERVLVHGGAGGVGSMAVQIAKSRGAYVLATASARNHDYLRSIGADELIDYNTVRFEDAVQSVDAVIDTVGGETLQRSPAVLRRNGRLVSIAGSISAEACAKAEIRCPAGVETEVTAALAEIKSLIDAGKLRVNVDATFPLERAAEAQEQNRAGHTRGKIVLLVP